MKTLMMTIGLPRSGKSTWAKKQAGIPVVNPDSIRLALHGQPFVKEAEGFVWAIAKVMVRSLFLAGHDRVILDSTGTTKARRDEWKSSQWRREFIMFQTSADTCTKRAVSTNKPELIPIIHHMSENWQEPTWDEDFSLLQILPEEGAEK